MVVCSEQSTSQNVLPGRTRKNMLRKRSCCSLEIMPTSRPRHRMCASRSSRLSTHQLGRQRKQHPSLVTSERSHRLAGASSSNPASAPLAVPSATPSSLARHSNTSSLPSCFAALPSPIDRTSDAPAAAPVTGKLPPHCTLRQPRPTSACRRTTVRYHKLQHHVLGCTKPPPPPDILEGDCYS